MLQLPILQNVKTSVCAKYKVFYVFGICGVFEQRLCVYFEIFDTKFELMRFGFFVCVCGYEYRKCVPALQLVQIHAHAKGVYVTAKSDGQCTAYVFSVVSDKDTFVALGDVVQPFAFFHDCILVEFFVDDVVVMCKFICHDVIMEVIHILYYFCEKYVGAFCLVHSRISFGMATVCLSTVGNTMV